MNPLYRSLPLRNTAASIPSPVWLAVLLFLAVLCPNNSRAQGALTNGWTHQGNISSPGDSDSWTFTANAGDTIVVRVGELVAAGFSPKLQLLSPTSVVLGSVAAATAVEISVVATNSGTFTAIVTDNSGTLTNAYRITLAKSPGAVAVAPGDEGGPLTNGVMHAGTITAGDLDVWTFNANSGDNIIVRMGENTDLSGNFTPWVRLYGPDGKLLDSSFGSAVGEVATTATNSGTFTVVTGDGNSALSGSGTYRLTLAKTGDPVVISAGDDGGPLTNGVLHTGIIATGDLDVWTFTANAGDSIIARMGEINDTNTFTPWLRLYGPNGKLLDSGFGALVGEVTATATNSGTFTLVAGDGNSGLFGSGAYRLTLAKTGDPVVISAGDNGGPMTNAVMHLGTIATGDLDMWTFNANVGDAIVVRIGEINDTNTFTPWLRLYGPNGKLLSSGFGALVGEVTATATNSGTFIVVAGDGNSGFFGSGDYRLTLAKTGDPVVISAGDDGGPMTNAVMHTGTIATGDLDVWTLSANTGDAIVVRVGEITDTNTFTPWVRLYSPAGVLLDSGFGATAGEVTVNAGTSGTYLVVVGDGNSGFFGSGDYRLTLAKTGVPVVISAGDDGGSMTNGLMHTGTVLPGDLDVWTISANAGEAIVVRVGEITATNSFTPWVRLYSPTGALLDSGFGASAGEVAVNAGSSGIYLAVVGDGNGAFSGSGTYRLTLAKTGSPVLTSAGDEGGPLDGVVNPVGIMDRGDLDLYSFTACAGDGIHLKLDELVDGGSFNPWIRLYGPNGTLLGNVSGTVTAQINVSALTRGRYLVVVADGNVALSGIGTYQLTVNGLSDGLKLCPPLVAGTNLNVTAVGGTPGADYKLFTMTNVAVPINLWVPVLTNQFDQFGVLTYSNLFNPSEPQRYFRLLEP